MDAALYLYTFKEGLLSKLAHDLRLRVTNFEVRARGTEVEARIDTRTLRIDGVMRGGKLERNDLGDGDRQKIQDNLNEVLRTAEFGDARFVGRAQSREPPFRIEGEFTLRGVTKPLSVLFVVREQRLEAELEIVPSQWGIKPFRALGGALKVQDRVRIVVHADAQWLTHGAELNPAVQLEWRSNLARASSRSSLRPSLRRES